jgi:hypothetical protein
VRAKTLTRMRVLGETVVCMAMRKHLCKEAISLTCVLNFVGFLPNSLYSVRWLILESVASLVQVRYVNVAISLFRSI